MIFSKQSIAKIVAGKKTQTRRPVKDGDHLLLPGEGNDLHRTRVVSGKGSVKVSTVKSYAVQPGRGKVGVSWLPETGKIAYPKTKTEADHLRRYNGFRPLRIWVTNIRREDVRQISRADAIAEGFPDERWFWATWCGFYDAQRFIAESIVVQRSIAVMQEFLRNRPDDLYQGWVYDFRVAKVY